MAYLDFGDAGRPVDAVFLNANGFNALTYRHILGPLADRYRILAIDQRGHGHTSLETRTEGRFDWLDLRDDLLAVLAALDLNGVVLAGHSMGGTVSVLAASAEPGRCRRLALFDPVAVQTPPSGRLVESPMVQGALRRRAVFPSRDAAMTSYRGRGAFRTWPDDMLADYVQAGFRDLPSGEVTLACAPAWEASGFAAHGHDTWGAFRQTLCPIEILRAETASTFHPDAAAGLDPNRIRISTIPGTTHFLPMERPDLVRSTLIAAIGG